MGEIWGPTLAHQIALFEKKSIILSNKVGTQIYAPSTYFDSFQVTTIKVSLSYYQKRPQNITICCSSKLSTTKKVLKYLLYIPLSELSYYQKSQ